MDHINWLELLNESLEESDHQLVDKFDREGHGSVFLLGLPRCASAFFIQILISTSNIGYINNRLANFYKTPLIGLMVDQMLGKKSYTSHLTSEYGNTTGDHEPHEWGWFWQKELGLAKGDHYMVPEHSLSRLGQLLNSVSAAKGAPVIYDSVFAMLNIANIKKNIPGTFAVYMERDPFYIANSILNARLSRYNDIETFYGYPTTNHPTVKQIENPVEQVVFQVKSCIEDVHASLNVFQNSEVFHLSYEDLIADPVVQVERFQLFLKKAIGFTLKVDYESFTNLPRFKQRNDPKLVHPRYQDELEYYFQKHFRTK